MSNIISTPNRFLLSTFIVSAFICLSSIESATSNTVPFTLTWETNGIDMTESGGVYTLQSPMKRDSWVFTSTFPASVNLEETSVITFDYQSSEFIEPVLYSVVKDGYSIKPNKMFLKTNNWTTFVVLLKAWDTGTNQALMAKRFRLGFRVSGAFVVKIKNLALRSATEAEDLEAADIVKKNIEKKLKQVPNEVYLSNDKLKVGVDLNLGGTITYISSPESGENVINSHDPGREIQQSYYSGPRPFGNPSPSWKDWGWNPIGAGDTYGNRSPVIATNITAREIYTKTIPLQWALDNVPGECTFETWFKLDDDKIRVHCRLNNARPDKTFYPAKSQELPALYGIGTYWRLFSYTNTSPFTGGEVSEIDTVRHDPKEFVWKQVKATESWCAFANDKGYAIGLIVPGIKGWLGGFSGQRNTGGPHDTPTSYLAPLYSEHIDHNIVYDYEFTVMLGRVEEIRKEAIRLRDDSCYHARFASNREHWQLVDALDQGFPIQHSLKLTPTNKTATIISPVMVLDPEVTKTISVKAKYHLKDQSRTNIELVWASGPGTRETSVSGITLPIINDGQEHTYDFQLNKKPTWIKSLGNIAIKLCGGAPTKEGDLIEILSVDVH